MAQSMEPYDVIVGMDIGTARMGVAFSMTKNPKVICCERASGAKEPSVVLLTKSDGHKLIAAGEEAIRKFQELNDEGLS